MSQPQTSAATAHTPPPAVTLQGVDHLALVTDDMKKTVAFYTQALGMPLVHVRRVPQAADRGQPPYDNLRHYFFDMGGELLAFFEYPANAPVSDRDSLGGMQHVAFKVDRLNFQRMQARLRALGVPYRGPVYLGDRFTSIYVFDPNNIRLEFTTDIDQDDYDKVASVYQTEAEIRHELETLFNTPEALQRILEGMPLRPT